MRQDRLVFIADCYGDFGVPESTPTTSTCELMPIRNNVVKISSSTHVEVFVNEETVFLRHHLGFCGGDLWNPDEPRYAHPVARAILRQSLC